MHTIRGEARAGPGTLPCSCLSPLANDNAVGVRVAVCILRYLFLILHDFYARRRCIWPQVQNGGGANAPRCLVSLRSRHHQTIIRPLYHTSPVCRAELLLSLLFLPCRNNVYVRERKISLSGSWLHYFAMHSSGLQVSLLSLTVAVVRAQGVGGVGPLATVTARLLSADGFAGGIYQADLDCLFWYTLTCTDTGLCGGTSDVSRACNPQSRREYAHKAARCQCGKARPPTRHHSQRPP
jgi:hypothetical protein